MGSTYGRQPLDSVGSSIQVSADGRPQAKPGGVTVDWSTIAVLNAGADTTFEEGVVVPAGEKALRYGQILTRITQEEAQTITVSGTPTGGTFAIGVTRPDTGATGTITLAWNSTVAQTQAAFDTFFGAGNTVVAGAGALPGNVQTVTFTGVYDGNSVPLMTLGTNGLTGGSSPSAAFATTIAADSTFGWYGPYDPAATDGRQTLLRGSCYIVNETFREADAHSNHPSVIEGGLCWKQRIIQAGSGTHSLAAGPTLAEFEAAFPTVRYAQ